MEIKYYGHSCFSVTVSGKVLLFDPFISGNELAKDMDTGSIKADYILLSHAHDDHSADALAIARSCNATIVGVWEITQWAIRNGHNNVHPMNIGGIWNFDFGMVKLTNAVHSSSFPDGTYGGTAAGFIVSDGSKTFYYAGDTALTQDMKLIPERYKLDFAFLPIGSNFTMDIDDAVKASEFIQCSSIIGMHYDTFGFIKIDHTEARKKFNAMGKLLMLFSIGETFEL